MLDERGGGELLLGETAEYRALLRGSYPQPGTRQDLSLTSTRPVSRACTSAPADLPASNACVDIARLSEEEITQQSE